MSFKDISLPKSVIAEIYKYHLVRITPKQDEKNENTSRGISLTPKAKMQFLGENLKNILVLVYYPDFVYLPEKQLDFLTKILIACKLDIGDIAIINTAKEPASEETINLLDARSIIFFGEAISDIVDQKKLEYFVPMNNSGLLVMRAPALENLSLNSNESKQLKGKLWTSLQQFFNL